MFSPSQSPDITKMASAAKRLNRPSTSVQSTDLAHARMGRRRRRMKRTANG